MPDLIPTSIVACLTHDQARELTDSAMADITHACEKIEAAYEGKAHLALGYPTWEAYLKAEFDMSRRRGYRLLTQAKVVKALGVTPKEINADQAQELAPLLSEPDKMREVLDSLPPKPPARIIKAKVDEVKPPKPRPPRITAPTITPTPATTRPAPPAEPPATVDALIISLQSIVSGLKRAKTVEEVNRLDVRLQEAKPLMQEALGLVPRRRREVVGLK